MADRWTAEDVERLLAELAEEMARQDRNHPSGYPATRDGIRLGIASAADEVGEARDEWHVEKRERDTAWPKTRGELRQAAAVCMRTIRSIDEVKP